MSTFLHVVESNEVEDAESFSVFAQQTLGTAHLYGKDMVVLKVRLNKFFKDNPAATYSTLVSTVEYVRAKRKRLAMPWAVIAFVPWAFKDGFLPELDPVNVVYSDPHVESGIAYALERENDPWWVSTLTHANGIKARRMVLGMWRTERCNA